MLELGLGIGHMVFAGPNSSVWMSLELCPRNDTQFRGPAPRASAESKEYRARPLGIARNRRSNHSFARSRSFVARGKRARESRATWTPATSRSVPPRPAPPYLFSTPPPSFHLGPSRPSLPSAHSSSPLNPRSWGKAYRRERELRRRESELRRRERECFPRGGLSLVLFVFCPTPQQDLVAHGELDME